MKKKRAGEDDSLSELPGIDFEKMDPELARENASWLRRGAIDARIEELNDWRGAMLGRLRVLIKEADPAVSETVKWRKPSNPSGVPVWEHDGVIGTGEIYKDKVKLTFAKGAALKDPSVLFNASLEGNTRRAIDLREGDKVNARAFKALIREAVTLNTAKAKR